MRWFVLIAGSVACGAFGASSDDDKPPVVAVDAGPDTAAAIHDASNVEGPCTADMPFISFAPIETGINQPTTPEYTVRLTADEQTAYVARADGNVSPYSFGQIFHRAVVDGTWKPGAVLFDATTEYGALWVSPNNERVYFERFDTGIGLFQLYRADVTGDGTTSEPIALNVGSATANNFDVYLSPDESELWYSSENGAGVSPHDIFHAIRGDGGVYGTFEPVSSVNTTMFDEGQPVISADGLTLYFASEQGRTNNVFAVRMAKRAAIGQPFGASVEPVGIGPLQDGAQNFSAAPTWISADNCRLYVSSTMTGATDLYVARRR